MLVLLDICTRGAAQWHRMHTVLLRWPWLGLALAIAMLVALGLRRVGTVGTPWRARLTDPAWLLWLLLPVYMLHQFEEHGVDALGRPYAFRAALCATLGWTDNLAHCPATEWFIFAVNPGTVWIAGLAAGLAGPRRVLVGAAALGIPAVNAAAHIVPALRTNTYNPGLVTAVVLFVPICAWTFRVLVARGLLRRVHLAYSWFAGMVVHGVLLLSLVAFSRGVIGEPLLVAVQLVNGFLPMAFAKVAGTLMPARHVHEIAR